MRRKSHAIPRRRIALARKPPPVPSTKQLAWLIVKAPGTRSTEEAAAVLQIGQDRDTAILIRLVRRFADMIRRVGTRAHDAGPAFDGWLHDAKRCGLRPVETFAAGLDQDGDAVRAALETGWSSAQVEGQVNKLKHFEPFNVRPRKSRHAPTPIGLGTLKPHNMRKSLFSGARPKLSTALFRIVANDNGAASKRRIRGLTVGEKGSDNFAAAKSPRRGTHYAFEGCTERALGFVTE